MDIVIPTTFPEIDFRAFGTAATHFFPELLSDEALLDPQDKRTHFSWSWQAVRYRYRSCAESTNEFKALLDNASEAWLSGWGDEELTYKLERCIYTFFMSGLSVFDSLSFCLYFLGNALHPVMFADVKNPRKITRSATHKAMLAAFPNASITSLLGTLSRDTRFLRLDDNRNRLAHRISGRRSIHSSITTHQDGTRTEFHKETWHIPGAADQLVFDNNLLQRHLDDVTDLLSLLASAARAFAEDSLSASEQK